VQMGKGAEEEEEGGVRVRRRGCARAQEQLEVPGGAALTYSVNFCRADGCEGSGEGRGVHILEDQHAVLLLAPVCAQGPSPGFVHAGESALP
jgi:hypothetical protein